MGKNSPGIHSFICSFSIFVCLALDKKWTKLICTAYVPPFESYKLQIDLNEFVLLIENPELTDKQYRRVHEHLIKIFQSSGQMHQNRSNWMKTSDVRNEVDNTCEAINAPVASTINRVDATIANKRWKWVWWNESVGQSWNNQFRSYQIDWAIAMHVVEEYPHLHHFPQTKCVGRTIWNDH